jgi:hypothetical protein
MSKRYGGSCGIRQVRRWLNTALIVAGWALSVPLLLSVFGNKVIGPCRHGCRIHPGRATVTRMRRLSAGRSSRPRRNANGFDEGNLRDRYWPQTVNAITQANGQKRLGRQSVGDGSLSSLVLETEEQVYSETGNRARPRRQAARSRRVRVSVVSMAPST